MSEHRFEVTAVFEPGARERLLGGGSRQLVTVRMFDGPGVIDARTGESIDTPEVLCDLRPCEARALAVELLRLAERAERIGDRR